MTQTNNSYLITEEQCYDRKVAFYKYFLWVLSSISVYHGGTFADPNNYKMWVYGWMAEWLHSCVDQSIGRWMGEWVGDLFHLLGSLVKAI